MKKALIIEINYIDTEYETYNEVAETGDNYEKPIKENIIKNIKLFIEQSKDYSELFIYYLGHSTKIIDYKNDYIPKGIVPMDYCKHGFIFDLDLRVLLSKIQCNLYLILDCCYGGYGYEDKYNIKSIGGALINDTNSIYHKYNIDIVGSSSKYKEENDEIENQWNIKILSMYSNLLRQSVTRKQTLSGSITPRLLEILGSHEYSINNEMLLRELSMKLNDIGRDYVVVLASNNDIKESSGFLVNSGTKEELLTVYKIPPYLLKNNKIPKFQNITRLQIDNVKNQNFSQSSARSIHSTGSIHSTKSIKTSIYKGHLIKTNNVVYEKIIQHEKKKQIVRENRMFLRKKHSIL